MTEDIKIMIGSLFQLEREIPESINECQAVIRMIQEYPDQELLFRLKALMKRAEFIQGMFVLIEAMCRSCRDRINEQEGRR